MAANFMPAARSGYTPQVQSDWNESDASARDFIKNKPDVVTQAQLATATGMSGQQLAQLNALLNALPTPRTNRPVVSGNYNLAETDLGVVLTLSGSTCFGPAYTSAQDGLEYGITNESSGTVTFQPTNGEFVMQISQPLSSIVIPSGESRQLTRETSTGNHNLVIV